MRLLFAHSWRLRRREQRSAPARASRGKKGMMASSAMEMGTGSFAATPEVGHSSSSNSNIPEYGQTTGARPRRAQGAWNRTMMLRTSGSHRHVRTAPPGETPRLCFLPRVGAPAKYWSATLCLVKSADGTYKHTTESALSKHWI